MSNQYKIFLKESSIQIYDLFTQEQNKGIDFKSRANFRMRNLNF